MACTTEDNMNQSMWFDTWIVVHENSTEFAENIFDIRRKSVITFGSLLVAWTILFNLLVVIGTCRGKSLRHVQPTNWLVVNFSLAQLLVGAFVVPLSVKTEKDGRWTTGVGMCRAWLLVQLCTLTVTSWALFTIALDRFVYVLDPVYHSKRIGTGKMWIMIITTWIIALCTTILPAVSMLDPDFILDEVCAISMTRQYAFGISFAAYYAPGMLTFMCTIAIAVTVLQRRGSGKQDQVATVVKQTVDVGAQDELYLLNSPKQDTGQLECLGYSPAFDKKNNNRLLCLYHFDSYKGVGNTAICVCVVNIFYLAMWAPFYVVNVLVPFCSHLCVDPTMWSIFIWMGYATAGVTPALWLLDRHIRRGLCPTNCAPCRASRPYKDTDHPGNVYRNSGDSDMVLYR